MDFERRFHFSKCFLNPPETGPLLAVPNVSGKDYAVFNHSARNAAAGKWGLHHMELRPWIGRRAKTARDSLQPLPKPGWIRRYAMTGALLAALWPPLAEAETETDRAGRIKASFVLNIARFVSWPKEAPEQQVTPLLLCLYRSNPFGEAIRTIEGKIVNGRPLQIGLIRSLAQSDSCRILLVGPDEMRHFSEESRQAPNRPLLTIADLTDTDLPSPHRPALITLVRNAARIGFEINLAKARRTGLRMSSNLLKLAKIVGDGT
ncbi:hypothetical protein Metal_0446 [Methylomicrobium album BG8]|uniref:YfiR family protein n=2 Tax=Methylococcaceae TaxID=403 RepID=H8GN70_METAL|nr:hypothetical protein Metal_0446 [Methylomicrobium album BG8]